MPVSMTDNGVAGLSTKFSLSMPTLGTVPPQGVINPAVLSAGASPSPLVVLLGVVGLLFLFKILSEHDATALDPAHLHIGGYNIAAVTLAAFVGFSSLKLLFNHFQVPGITPLVNFV